MIQALWITDLEKEDLKNITNIEGYDIKIRKINEVKDEEYEEAEVIIGKFHHSKLPLCKNVKWIQLEMAGVDNYTEIDKEIILTNCSGAFGEIISEYMLSYLLLSSNNLLDYYKNQKEKTWTNIGRIKALSELSILSIGMGDIGSLFSKKAHLLGAKVSGLRRTRQEKEDYLDKLYTIEELDEAIKDYDVIAISLPATKDTYHLFDYARLMKMKKGSVLINVGRGSTIVSEDLIRAVNEKHFSSVFLDVFEVEPLPMNNPLWNLENVYITPHITGNYNADITVKKVLEIINTNLINYRDNKPLINIVDKSIGY